MLNHQPSSVGLAALAVITALLGSCRQLDPHSSGSSPSPSSSAPSGSSGTGGPLALLTPEQVSNQLASALNLTYTSTSPSGAVTDKIMTNYAVPLGGVDYGQTRVRNSVPTVQTQLVARHLAFQAASDVVTREDSGTASPSLFDQCTLKKDKPYTASAPATSIAAQQSDQRWRAQITSFYWRLFARPPTSDEVNNLADTFSTALSNEKSFSAAWVITLYAMLSSAEFWNQ